MEFKKVTISLPKSIYEQGMNLVNTGLFSNFSDLVRSGIREESKDLQNLSQDFDEKHIYNDTELINGVRQSIEEANAGKGKIIKTKQELDKYFEAL